MATVEQELIYNLTNEEQDCLDELRSVVDPDNNQDQRRPPDVELRCW